MKNGKNGKNGGVPTPEEVKAWVERVVVGQTSFRHEDLHDGIIVSDQVVELIRGLAGMRHLRRVAITSRPTTLGQLVAAVQAAVPPVLIG